MLAGVDELGSGGFAPGLILIVEADHCMFTSRQSANFEQIGRTSMYLCVLFHLCDRSDSKCGKQTPPCIVNFCGASSGLYTRIFSNLHTKNPICIVEAKDRLAWKVWGFKWIQTYVNLTSV